MRRSRCARRLEAPTRAGANAGHITKRFSRPASSAAERLFGHRFEPNGLVAYHTFGESSRGGGKGLKLQGGIVSFVGAMLALLLVVLTAPPPAGAQPAERTYRIGYLGEGRPEDAPPLRAMWDGLRELGYVEGRNLVIEQRYAGFRYERMPDLAAELVQLKPDVVVTGGSPGIAGHVRGGRL